MRSKACYFAGIAVGTLAAPASADIIYGSPQEAIPTTYGGLTVNVGDGTLNPFFGGAGVANNNALQPFRVTDNGGLATVMNFGTGATIDSGSGYLATGAGGSINHLGSGGTFTAGTEGYVGFQLDGANYGWMRVVLTNNTSSPVPPVVKDWAYDNTGAAIKTGWINTDIVSDTAQTVTLNPGTGESFTLGSQLANASGTITTSVVKTGAGTTILTSASNYSGATTINAGVLSIATSASTGSGNVTVNNAGTKLTGNGTVGGNTTINTGAILAPGNSVGKEAFSNGITFATGSIFEWELAVTPAETGRGTGYDAVNVGGSPGGSGAIFRVVLNGSQDFSESFWDTNRTWTDIFKTADAGGLVSYASVFSEVQYWNSSSGSVGTPTAQGQFTINGSSLNWTAVPEPSGTLAGLLLGAGMLRRRRIR